MFPFPLLLKQGSRAAEALVTAENALGRYQDGYRLRAESVGKGSSPTPILINIALSDSISGFSVQLFLYCKVLYP